jgi:hypothetical protein
VTRRGGRRDWPGIGCAALLGASIAFPLGLYAGRDSPPRDNARPASRPAPSPGRPRTGRDVYSPRVTGDPYVIEQQRKVLRALEASCSQSGQLCPEAEQARLRIEEAEAAR